MAEGNIKRSETKSLIFYHRAHITFSNTKCHFCAFGFVFIILSLVVFFLFEDITLQMNLFAKNVLSHYFTAGNIEISGRPFLYQTVYILDMPGKYPSPVFSFVLFMLSLAVIFFINKTRLIKPIVIWGIYVSIINFIAAAFFILWPDMFPYGVKAFSELYIKAQVVIWLFVPMLMGAALSSLPSNVFSKIGIAFSALLYSLVFGIVRYVVFLYALAKFSFVFMPIMFFIFGPLMDFVYMVTIYSLHVSCFANKIGKDLRIWKWLS